VCPICVQNPRKVYKTSFFVEIGPNVAKKWLAIFFLSAASAEGLMSIVPTMPEVEVAMTKKGTTKYSRSKYVLYIKYFCCY